MFSFKKFLPRVMQNTKWGDLAEVWQSIWLDIKTDKILPIFNQIDIETASIEELKLMLKGWGYDFRELTGYTATRDFLYKQALFCTRKIKNKSTQTGFVYVGVPFNLVSTGYSIIYDTSLVKYFVDETLEGNFFVATTELDREAPNISYYTPTIWDSGLKFDANPINKFDTLSPIIIPSVPLTPSYLDSDEFPQLDGSLLLYTITRNFAYSYIHKFVENANEFMSIDTLSVLYGDINQVKKVTDRCYYEPHLEVPVNIDNTLNTRFFYDYLGNHISDQKSILINDIGSAYKVRFGNGTHVTVDTSITDVQSFVFERIINVDMQIKSLMTDSLAIRGIITEFQKFPAITEIALLDSTDTCVLYTTFPKIQWYEKMYSNIQLTFTLI